MPEYPEHEKLKEFGSDRTQIIGEFLDWLHSHNYEICQWNEGDLRFDEELRTIEDWLAAWAGIDVDAFHREKARMLARIRVQNTLRDIEEIGSEDAERTRDT